MRLLILVTAALLASAATASAPQTTPRWSEQDLAQLADMVEAARDEGLHESYSGTAIAMMAPGADTDGQADTIALALARDFYEGSDRMRSDPSWHLTRGKLDYRTWLNAALARHSIEKSLRDLLPATANYEAVQTEMVRCRRKHGECGALEVNLDRLRALPRDLGRRYLIVNVPAYRLDLIEDGKIVASHKVIVGKPNKQTPIFKATVTGVTINPWWNVPCSIVDESIGKLIRTNPEEAARRGYVFTKSANGTLTVRQKPGPDNALGQIKLEMPNPYDVYIHDTPSRNLFLHDRRALSHGCIRTEDPEGLAASLLGNDKALAIGLLLGTRISKTIPLTPPLPVYVVYLTAGIDPETGKLARYDDIYHRDGD